MGFEPVDTLDDVPNIQKSVMFRFISQLFTAKNVLCFQHAVNFSNYQLLNAWSTFQWMMDYAKEKM